MSLPPTKIRSSVFSLTIPIIQGKLYWFCGSTPPKQIPGSFYFCIDDELIYEPLLNDFGPFTIKDTLIFVKSLKDLLAQPMHKDSKVYHYTTSTDPKKKLNAAFLIAAFQIIELGRSCYEIMSIFRGVTFISFSDSSNIPSDYKCTVQYSLNACLNLIIFSLNKLEDCVKGLEYSKQLGWINENTLNISKYNSLRRYDITEVIPGKLIAFQNPEIYPEFNNDCCLTIDNSIIIFKQLGVTLVIRLNSSSYSSSLYEREGIKHKNLIFPDGTEPSLSIMNEFLQLVESEKGLVAIHCKAGRGRTGCLIGCYAMKHFLFPARAFIGYVRLMRPGSIHGPQQQFLSEVEDRLFTEGKKNNLVLPFLKLHQIDKSSQKFLPMDSPNKKNKILSSRNSFGSPSSGVISSPSTEVSNSDSPSFSPLESSFINSEAGFSYIPSECQRSKPNMKQNEGKIKRRSTSFNNQMELTTKEQNQNQSVFGFLEQVQKLPNNYSIHKRRFTPHKRINCTFSNIEGQFENLPKPYQENNEKQIASQKFFQLDDVDKSFNKSYRAPAIELLNKNNIKRVFNIQQRDTLFNRLLNISTAQISKNTPFTSTQSNISKISSIRPKKQQLIPISKETLNQLFL